MMIKKVKVTDIPTKTIGEVIAIHELLGDTAYIKKVDKDFYLIISNKLD